MTNATSLPMTIGSLSQTDGLFRTNGRSLDRSELSEESTCDVDEPEHADEGGDRPTGGS